jgi:splicing factor U2AF subunit
MNMVCPEDVVDDDDHHQVIKLILTMTKDFGEVLSIEIPRPDPETGVCTVGVGKIFIKFNTIVGSKRARMELSGREYNNKVIVCAYYPEKYFDTQEFDVI